MRRPFPLDPVDLARQAADDARGRIDATGDRLAAIAEDGEVLRLYPSDSSALASQGRAHAKSDDGEAALALGSAKLS